MELYELLTTKSTVNLETVSQKIMMHYCSVLVLNQFYLQFDDETYQMAFAIKLKTYSYRLYIHITRIIA